MIINNRMTKIRKLVAMLLFAALLTACTTTKLATDSWKSTKIGPCERLTMIWNVQTTLLQDIVGTHFTPHDENANGQGQLHLSVMQCNGALASQAHTKPTRLAQVMIPLSPDKQPIHISSISRDAWFHLPVTLIKRNADVSRLFSQHGYAVLDSDISFSLSPTNSKTMLDAHLKFAKGRINLSATIEGKPKSHETTSSLVSAGVNFYSAFFGKETAKRYSAVSAVVQIEGDTILSDLNLSEIPVKAVFDTNLESDRLFWNHALKPK